MRQFCVFASDIGRTRAAADIIVGLFGVLQVGVPDVSFRHNSDSVLCFTDYVRVTPAITAYKASYWGRSESGIRSVSARACIDSDFQGGKVQAYQAGAVVTSPHSWGLAYCSTAATSAREDDAVSAAYAW